MTQLLATTARERAISLIIELCQYVEENRAYLFPSPMTGHWGIWNDDDIYAEPFSGILITDFLHFCVKRTIPGSERASFRLPDEQWRRFYVPGRGFIETDPEVPDWVLSDTDLKRLAIKLREGVEWLFFQQIQDIKQEIQRLDSVVERLSVAERKIPWQQLWD